MSLDAASPNLVADFLLCKSREQGEVLTNLKLQKLLYYAQAWFLVLKGEPLFEEDFQAWVHGPVLPSQYHRFKQFKWSPITEEVVCPELSVEVAEHLNEIIQVFGVETAIALEQMTHEERPWRRARNGVPDHQPSNEIIRKEWMDEYYSELADAEDLNV